MREQAAEEGSTIETIGSENTVTGVTAKAVEKQEAMQGVGIALPGLIFFFRINGGTITNPGTTLPTRPSIYSRVAISSLNQDLPSLSNRGYIADPTYQRGLDCASRPRYMHPGSATPCASQARSSRLDRLSAC